MITAIDSITLKPIFAEVGRKAICPDCGKPVFPKCGMEKRNHFAHYKSDITLNCQSVRFYDGISEWHMDWQFQIKEPEAGINIEVYIKKGEYAKRADVVTKNGLIIEFQKSHLPYDERILREKYYNDMIWVIHHDLSTDPVFNKITKIPVLIDYDSYLEEIKCGYQIDKSEFISTIMNCENTSNFLTTIRDRLELLLEVKIIKQERKAEQFVWRMNHPKKYYGINDLFNNF